MSLKKELGHKTFNKVFLNSLVFIPEIGPGLRPAGAPSYSVNLQFQTCTRQGLKTLVRFIMQIKKENNNLFYRFLPPISRGLNHSTHPDLG